MAAIRLSDGSGGCPPTQTPPAGYDNPFRFDSAGRLWVTSCFRGFQYLGAARHDLPVFGILGGPWVPAGASLLAGGGIVGGTYATIAVTNGTECTMGIMLAMDMTLDLEVRADNLSVWSLSSRWNGAHHSLCQTSNVHISNSTELVRQYLGASANLHDLGFELGLTGGVGTTTVNTATNPGGTALLQLAPGASATIGAKLFMHYAIGAATGTETIYKADSAVRAYGYMIEQ